MGDLVEYLVHASATCLAVISIALSIKNLRRARRSVNKPPGGRV